MQEYSVRIVVPVAVRIDCIMAESQIDAIRLAEESVEFQSFNQTFSQEPITGQDRPVVRYTEYADSEMPVSALVDEVGDEAFCNSAWYVPADGDTWKVDPASLPPVQPVKPRVVKVCAACGSEDIKRDAWASFNVETQQWELETAFDDAFCESCDGECSIVDKELVALRA